METTTKTKNKSTIDAQPKFNVKDSVKVKKGCSYPLKSNSKGIVERIAKSDSGRCYLVRFPMGTSWVYENQLRKA